MNTLGANRKKELVYDGKFLGYINDEVFEVRRWVIDHIAYFTGWSFSVDILEMLDDRNITGIRIFDIQTRKSYFAKLSDFRDFGIPVAIADIPYLCLTVVHWRVTDDDPNIT